MTDQHDPGADLGWPAGVYALACQAIAPADAPVGYASNTRVAAGAGVKVDQAGEYAVMDAMPAAVRRIFNFQAERNSIAFAVKTVIEHGVPFAVWVDWLPRNVAVLGRGLSPVPREYATNTRSFGPGVRPAAGRRHDAP